ncbi:MAG: alpha/beta hydrolase [Hyphomicrobiaceae bacterium]
MLLHAAGSGPRPLDRFARRLAGPGWSTLAPLLERDGRPLVGQGTDPFAAAVALAGALIGEAPSSPRVLFGHSMGGLVALKAALAGAAADLLVLYEPIVLALLDPVSDREPLARDSACIADFRACMEAGDPEAGVRRFVEAYGDGPWEALPDRARAALAARAQSLFAEAEATNRATLEAASLDALRAPVLLLSGSRSPEVLGRMTQRLAGLLPDVHHLVVQDAGHMGPVTHPEATAAHVAAWCARRLR